MAFSFVASTTSSGTTPSGAINTTGATLLVYTQKYDTNSPVTPSDNQSNTPTGLTAQDASFNVSSRQWYVINPTTNASHTFTAGASAQMTVEAWSGTSPTFDTQGGNNAFPGSTSWAGPSVTPANANSLILAAFGIYGGGVTNTTVSGGGFSSVRVQLIAGGGILSSASIVQGAAAASQATWGNDGASAIVTSHAVVFYEGAGAGGGGFPFSRNPMAAHLVRRRPESKSRDRFTRKGHIYIPNWLAKVAA
jgi:hypothetical protein